MTEKVIAEEKTEENAEKKVKKEPEKERTVTIKLPRERNKGDLFVSVNERTFIVKRGVPVDVPECVAEVIRTAERNENERLDIEEQLQSK